MRRAVNTLLASVLISGLGLAAAVTLEACSSADAESTGGKRVVLSTRVTLDSSGAAPFSNAGGWSVTLTKAALAAGPFYYFDGAPPLVYNEPRPSWQYAQRALGLSVAHAHPGHYQAGNAMGQMLESDTVDLLAGPAEFPKGDGITGTYRSARFTLAAPGSSARALLQGHSVLVEGKAEKDGEASRYFRAHADLDVIGKHASGGKIEGCELHEVNVEGDGTITVTVKPQVWFELVDFADAPEGASDAPAGLPDDSLAQLGFIIGVSQLSAYQFSYDAT